jgi:hypothetical protein
VTGRFTHFNRAIEQDLLPVTQLLVVELSHVISQRLADCEDARATEGVYKAALLALAVTGEAVMQTFGVDIEAWAQANRIAQTPSLTTTAALLPATTYRLAELEAG